MRQGPFTRNDKHIGQFGTYENKDDGKGYTNIKVTAHRQTTATTSVKAGDYEGHVTASASANRSNLVFISFEVPVFYYAGGITN